MAAYIAIGFPRYARDKAETLIYPSAACAAAILFVLIVGRAEIAILVKIIFGVLVVLLHVNLKFFAGTATFPAVIAIGDSVGGFRG
jgi:uncharacterized integral membrane protein